MQAVCVLNIAVKWKLTVSNLKLWLRYSIHQHVTVSTHFCVPVTAILYGDISCIFEFGLLTLASSYDINVTYMYS
jgi:hypothetical protein